jgi:hypothetical protein
VLATHLANGCHGRVTSVSGWLRTEQLYWRPPRVTTRDEADSGGPGMAAVTYHPPP